jgi:hypothetical protein
VKKILSLNAQQIWTSLSSCVPSCHTMHATESCRQSDVGSKYAPRVQEHQGTAPRLRPAAALCCASEPFPLRSPSGTLEGDIVFAVDIAREAEPFVRDVDLYAFSMKAICRRRYESWLRWSIKRHATLASQLFASPRVCTLHSNYR